MGKIEKIENIVISDPKKLEKIKRLIKGAGPEKLHILSDFDRTLTMAFVNGEYRPSLTSILRDEGYLTPDYGLKAKGLYSKYHAIEIDSGIPLAKKKKLMAEWWQTHFNLLLKSGLNKKDLKRAVESGKVKFRDGFYKFVNLLKRYKIPLVIMSASGLGGEAVSMYFKKAGKLYDNIHIISNSYLWDKNGNALKVQRPIIHSLNKDETMVRDFPAIYKKIKDRKNVILLGDSIEDVAMIKGFKFDNLVKVGFLNEGVKENLEKYKKHYDVLILNDGQMEYVNDLLREVVGLSVQ